MGYRPQNISVAGSGREFLECKYGSVRVGAPGIDGVRDRAFLDCRSHPCTDSRNPGRRPSCSCSARQASAPAEDCLLYTSDAADEEDSVDLGGRRIIKKKK